MVRAFRRDAPPVPVPEAEPTPSQEQQASAIGRSLVDSLRRTIESGPDRRLRELLSRASAEARAAVLDLLPLPIYELAKLKGLDPFVARATAASYHTSGRHFLILAGPPVTEGDRAAQLAHELLARAHRVTYVSRFPPRERQRRRRGLVHENFSQARFQDFSARSFALERRPSERLAVLCELPLPEYRACAHFLKLRGAQSVYDVVEDWPASRASWYSQRAEQGLIKEADLVIASGRALKDAVEARAWRDVSLVPNAVNARIFARGRSYPRPGDLPRAEAVYVYAGSMWGDWVAWDWLVALARARPQAAVLLLGDYRGQCKNPPRNMVFLGHRPQSELPAYFAHCDVGLIPYRADRLTRPANPLKLYEYLAMGKPVVTADLPEVHELPGVQVASSVEEFVAAVVRARQLAPSEEQVARFVSENSWKARVRQLERIVAG